MARSQSLPSMSAVSIMATSRNVADHTADPAAVSVYAPWNAPQFGASHTTTPEGRPVACRYPAVGALATVEREQGNPAHAEDLLDPAIELAQN